jgi:hypothetical protein
MFFFALALVALGGCTAAKETKMDITNKFERGIIRQGQVVERDPLGDDFGSYYQ